MAVETAGAAPASSDPVEKRFAATAHRYAIFVYGRYPVVATYVGASTLDPALANIDGQLRNYHTSAIANEDRCLAAFQAELRAYDARGLSPAERVDQQVAQAQIRFMLRQHGGKLFERSLDSFVDEPFRGVEWQLQGMADTAGEGRGTELEWRHLVQRLQSVPSYLAVAQERLEDGIKDHNAPDARMILSFGWEVTGADAEYLETELPAIAALQIRGPSRAKLLQDVRAASASAAKAYRGLRRYVARRFLMRGSHGQAIPRPTFRGDRFAVGEAEYDWALHNNLRIDLSAAELYQESWPIVAATRTAMIALARIIAVQHGWQMSAGPEELVRTVERRLGDHAPANDAQMLASYQETGRRLLEYARRTRLFDVPPGYRLEVMLTPQPLRSSVDDAAYYAAPALKGTGVGHFYVTPSDDDVATLRAEHNSSAVAVLAAHEGFPGHDLHHRTMAANRADISPIRFFTPGAVEDSSSMWADSMADEGWALYVEALLAEPQPGAGEGFYTPEERLYQLRAKLYRDLRVGIDTGIHTGRMQFNQAVDLFSQVVDFLPGSCLDRTMRGSDKHASCVSARRAIYRYSRWPTQALAYRLGKDAIIDSRQRAQGALGTRFSLQLFHTEWMRFGPIPTPYFAEDLLQVLTKTETR